MSETARQECGKKRSVCCIFLKVDFLKYYFIFIFFQVHCLLTESDCLTVLQKVGRCAFSFLKERHEVSMGDISSHEKSLFFRFDKRLEKAEHSLNDFIF